METLIAMDDATAPDETLASGDAAAAVRGLCGRPLGDALHPTATAA